MRMIFVVLIMLTGNAFADNLSPDDYFGIWGSSWTAVEGETQKLQINADLSSIFIRTFVDGERESFRSNQSEMIGDLLLLKYFDKEGRLQCQLVLSGWKVDDTKRIYGTMYMYRQGVQFNGLPVSFSHNQGED